MRRGRRVDQPANEWLAERCKFGCRGLHDMHPKKDSVCCGDIFKWVYWWASNYASPGLLFCVAEGPAPRHLQGRHAGGYKLHVAVHMKKMRVRMCRQDRNRNRETVRSPSRNCAYACPTAVSAHMRCKRAQRERPCKPLYRCGQRAPVGHTCFAAPSLIRGARQAATAR